MIPDEPRIEMILDEPRIEHRNCLWLGTGINLWECLCLTVNSSYLLIRVTSSIQLFTLGYGGLLDRAFHMAENETLLKIIKAGMV